MESSQALDVFTALSQVTRLNAFRLIVKQEPEGLPAGEIARLLDIPQNTMSTHLAVLVRARLISAERRGRSVIYRAEIDTIRAIASFLVNDCCGGRPELCESLMAEFAPCYSPEKSVDVR